MLEMIAAVLVYSLVGYATAGLLFAIPFIWFGVQKLDSQAQGAGVGFRLLILPGVAAFWPVFLIRIVRGVTEPPVERNPHR